MSPGRRLQVALYRGGCAISPELCELARRVDALADVAPTVASSALIDAIVIAAYEVGHGQGMRDADAEADQVAALMAAVDDEEGLC